MARPPKRREPRTTIFHGHDGRYHAFVPAGLKRNGEVDRRHRSSVDYGRLVDKVLELEDQVDRDEIPHIGKSPTFESWLNEWLDTVAPLTAKYKTLQAYRSHVRNYLVPYLGQWRLSQLTKRHFAEMYRDLSGVERLAASSVHSVHRVATAALNRALDFEVVGLRTNPAAEAVKALPAIPQDDVEPLAPDEIKRVLTAATQRRNHIRWWAAFLGPRQGEVLGLKWSDVDWEIRFAKIQRQLQRQTYRHGCAEPAACARPYCMTGGCDASCRSRVWEHGCADARACAAPNCARAKTLYPSDIKRGTQKRQCPPECTGHARGCPQRRRSECRIQWHRTGCADGCTDHAKRCPDRVGGLVLVEAEPEPLEGSRRSRSRRGRKSERQLRPKTAAGNRRLPLPPEFMAELAVHKLNQDAERERAGNLWADLDLIVCDPLGRPVDPSRDLEEWGELLDEADVEYIELHGARKSAATAAGGENLDPVVRNAMMGWTSAQMASRYQAVPIQHLINAGDALGRVMFGGSATGGATNGEDAAGPNLDEI